MNRNSAALALVGLGASLMYFVDPDRGGRRRARARDAAVHLSRVAAAAAGRTTRDVRHRVNGFRALAAAQCRDWAAVSDDVLVARVRARLGRLVSHPHAINVQASSGAVTLTGPVLQAEVEQVLAGIGKVKGVSVVNNRLDVHARAAHEPALQGPGARHVGALPNSWRAWPPSMRLVAAVTGLGLVAFSIPGRSARRTAAGAIGVDLLERAVTARHA